MIFREEKIEETENVRDEIELPKEIESDPYEEIEQISCFFTEILCDGNGKILESCCSEHEMNEMFIPTLRKGTGKILIAFKSDDQKTDVEETEIVLALINNPMMKSQIEVNFGIKFL